MDNVDEAWLQFKENPMKFMDDQKKTKKRVFDVPKCGDLNISTKTMIAFLNIQIALKDIFWKLNVINYYDNTEGIIKKQIKINCKNIEESKILEEQIRKINNDYLDVTILKQNDGKIGCFRDNRKISIGLSKKDLLKLKKKQRVRFITVLLLFLGYLRTIFIRKYTVKFSTQVN